MKKLMLAVLMLAGFAMASCANPDWIPGDSGMSGHLVPVDAHGMYMPVKGLQGMPQ